ncbi:hypothetical protein HBI56_123240 [Parastagonospora nodorum]|nr:hypothetical protein HBI10_149180 [Parastagonospora nodorum]KAH4020115.1 hypothetical protein HBI13_122320 [Parastagonospora nodorum]KAH4076673.1 hypothetical protein HBH50_008910 [Parastagonospora nodorum]KAH4095844.1 hypothetical protein HBH48_048850 [Parastagonospora nodorum]KAH4169551.1 hypothetical protein HBH43_119030 [Parastagonospora nodorum]
MAFLPALFLLVATATATATSTAECCDLLAQTFPSQLVLPDSNSYNASTSSYFFMQQRVLAPTCIVQPKSDEDVSKVVKTIQSCTDVEVAIRSGGHSPNVGFSNANAGVTIDLRGLNKIELSADGNTVELGTGNEWINVYEKLDPLGKSVVGARVADVGVGGFLSGGGISFFSPRDGFGCDSIQSMRVVLASGAIVTASPQLNPTLFKALKGGQNNFGIITSFTLRTITPSRFWGGAVVTPESADPAQIEAFTKFKQAPHDPLLEIEQTFVYYGSQKSYFVSNNLFFLSDSEDRSSLDQFTSITPNLSSTLRLSNVTDFAREVQAGQPMNFFTVYATTTFPITDTNIKLTYDIWKATTESLKVQIPELTSAMTYQSIPPPTSDTSLFPFSTLEDTSNLVLLLISVYSPKESDYAVLQQSTKDFINDVETLLREPGNGGVSPYKYLNYAASWQDPLSGYGENTVQELKATAKQYDPYGFFQNVVKGGYKLK